MFAASIAPRLGVSMPQVSSGTYSELRITTSTTAGTRAKGDARESTAAVLGAVSTKPRSLSARLSLRAEDILEIGTAQFEPALRANLTMALSSEYDEQCLNGDGSGSHVDGLIHQLTRPTNPTAVATFDTMLGHGRRAGRRAVGSVAGGRGIGRAGGRVPPQCDRVP